jgi:membrane-bound ClpP family serine protease
VGRMELESEHFRDKLMALLASPQVAVRLMCLACFIVMISFQSIDQMSGMLVSLKLKSCCNILS